jgi:hypothetical protein
MLNNKNSASEIMEKYMERVDLQVTELVGE